MLKDKKIIIIIVVVLLILISIFLLLIKNKKFNYNNLLSNKDLDIVYPKVNTETDKVPNININNEVINNINKDIDNIYEDYLIFSAGSFSYNYNVSKDTLSLIITAYITRPESNNLDIIYKSYNVDLKKMKLLTDKDILDKFNITEEKMNYYLSNKFFNYYSDLINNNYFTQEQCDFKCFLESKNVENLLDNNNYYINNNHLELYKSFNIYTDYNEEKYFNENSFHFIVT